MPVLPPALLSLSRQALLLLGPVAGALAGIGPFNVTLVSPPPEAQADPASPRCRLPAARKLGRAGGSFQGSAVENVSGPGYRFFTQDIGCKNTCLGCSSP